MGEGLSGFLGQFRIFDGYGYYDVPDKLTDVEEVYMTAESDDKEVDVESLYPFGCTGGLTLEINCPMGRVMHLYKFGHGLVKKKNEKRYLDWWWKNFRPLIEIKDKRKRPKIKEELNGC